MLARTQYLEPRPDTPEETRAAALRGVKAKIDAIHAELTRMYPIVALMPDEIDQALTDLDVAAERLGNLANQIENGEDE
jgi:hypothetical protein